MSATHRVCFLLVVIVASWSTLTAAAAECQLLNPSFEISGASRIFEHWTTFGPAFAIGTLTEHGQRAAAAAGSNSGGWSLSGVWQEVEASAGDVWRARVYAGHLASQSLVGSAAGVINIEWRDAGGDLIDYETLTAITVGTPAGVLDLYELTTNPAPTGTVAARLVLGFLQSPALESGAVVFDQVAFDNLNGLTLDDVQWGDFPGGVTLDFAGYSWRVKGPGYYGPGPNWFTTRSDHVFVDGDGHLQLNVQPFGERWYSSEVVLEEPLGYGDYVFTTGTNFEPWADNVVLGLFLWQYALCFDSGDQTNRHNEFDVEISRWNTPGNDLGQFVAQPSGYAGNLNRFALPVGGGIRLSFAIRWLPDRVECRAWRGGVLAENASTLFQAWTYTGPHLPRHEQPRVHLNLWYLNDAPNDQQQHTASIENFAFVPACVDPTYGEGIACWETCLNGPDQAIPGSCSPRDYDADQDFDLRDLAQIR